MSDLTRNSQSGQADDRCDLLKITRNRRMMKKGIHVIYTYYERDIYIENAAAFIGEGLDERDGMLVIEQPDLYRGIVALLEARGYSRSSLDAITFFDNEVFYLSNAVFNVEGSIRKIQQALYPYMKQGVSIRTWGQVSIPQDTSFLSKLRLYEGKCDAIIREHRITSVCAYNGLTIPSYIQNEMLKVHDYLMTDHEIMLSPLYKEEYLHVPSIYELDRLRKIEEENVRLSVRNAELQRENDTIRMRKAVIEENERFYRNLINELPFSILITNDERIVYVNQTGITNLNSCYLLGKSFSQLFHGLSHISANGLNEYYFAWEDAEDAPHFAIKSIPIWFEGEHALLHALIDITEQKLHERLMVRSEKLNIAGELAAGIAHEIRNPLTSIKGFMKLLENGQNEHYFRIINDEISRIEQISGELLMLAKPYSDKYATANMVELIGSVKTLLETQAILKSIEIELISDTQHIYVHCEETKIRQVFINIIKNAIEVMDRGKVCIHINELNDKVHIAVTDEGYGMSKELLERIGEPFYTTKEKGTGLGLMVCYRIVESHNGSIQVSSEEGVGTTFTVTLPVTKRS